MGMTKSLSKRIVVANRYILWAMDRGVWGTGYMDSTFPVSIEYTHEIKVSPAGHVVTVTYNDHATGEGPTATKFDLRAEFGAEDLRYEITHYIIRAIRNGAADDGLSIPSFKA